MHHVVFHFGHTHTHTNSLANTQQTGKHNGLETKPDEQMDVEFVCIKRKKNVRPSGKGGEMNVECGIQCYAICGTVRKRQTASGRFFFLFIILFQLE